jgi:hypothetical protein
MSRVDALIQRYAASASLVRNGVQIVAVTDVVGARFDAAIRQFIRSVKDDLAVWDDLIRPATMLRWQLVTRPQPGGPNPVLGDAAAEVTRQVQRLRGAVANGRLLDDLAVAAEDAAASESPLGPTLRTLIDMPEATGCLFVAASRAAQASLSNGWGSLAVRVLTSADLGRETACVDQAIAIGPPRFFGAALVTAPAAYAVTFVIPSWVRDRLIPFSAIADYAEDGAIRIRSHVRALGHESALEPPEAEQESDDELAPHPVWGFHREVAREPASDEVTARKVLLSGNLAIWLDDFEGERIRTLDPVQPAGERVTYAKVKTVQPGTYLLLRRGATEHSALLAAAIQLLGGRGPGIDTTQRAWKEALARRLDNLGYVAAAEGLRSRGVKASDRTRAWADPALIRPHSDDDFRHLLEWLGISAEPSFTNATALRRAHYRASARVREELETAVDGADLARLDRDGHLSLGIPVDGFRGMIATRVLAISPHADLIARRHARVPYTDRGAQWLE